MNVTLSRTRKNKTYGKRRQQVRRKRAFIIAIKPVSARALVSPPPGVGGILDTWHFQCHSEWKDMKVDSHVGIFGTSADSVYNDCTMGSFRD